MPNTVYKDYFRIDENYFPCVNESAINAGLKWDDFYPHSTFIDLLRKTERIIGGQEKRSLWISGAYGTGKSYAAFALSRLLTATNDDVTAYFNKYEALAPHRTDLMQRIIGAKNEGQILTCYRYASSAINNTNDLIIVIQELIAKAVINAGLEYKGENTLKQSILKWLDNSLNKTYFDGYVSGEYKDLFGGWSTDEIIDKLNKDESSADLVGKINQMASEIGITAIKTDMDGLIAYIKDIISGNKLKAIVLVLDEFSEFFQNNRGRLTDFQKLVETCAESPFYLLVVAHDMGKYFHEKDSDAKKIKDRFIPCEIKMPDNIAFDLMQNALKIKDEAKKDWAEKLDDLQDFTKKSRKAVSDCTGITTEVLKGVLPLHPMSALLLKHISEAFESNQRSMFDFIKNDGDYKAFQWFIENHGPLDGTTALLTVDMLWDFFYETGRDNLTTLIRNILDTYKKAEQRNLMSEEKQVLKTILIMQAVSTHLNDAVPLFITNDQNLYLCFEGTDYEHKAPAIADKLTREEILFKKPLGNNRFCYATTVMPGDVVEVDNKKNEIVDRLRTQDLCIEEMTRVFSLTAPLKMRYTPTFATHDDITQKTNQLVNQENLSGFHAIIGVAKDDNEAVLLRRMMQDKITSVVPDNKNIIFIDTTPTPFGADNISQYADYMARSEILRSRDPAASDDMLRKGKKVAGDWGLKIYNGQIIVYSHNKPDGERYNNWGQVQIALQQIVKTKYPQVFEFESGLSEVTFQSGSKPQWVEAGILEKTGGATATAEKIVSASRRSNYWETDPYSSLGIIKNALDAMIEKELSENSKVSIIDILTFLCDEYGFVPSNLYAFLTGFLLKEYAVETYRLSDDANNEKMSPEKMKEVVDEGYKQLYVQSPRYRDKFIRIMSHEEQLFCSLMSEIFEIPEAQCGSVEDTIKRVRIKAKSFGLPLWILNEKASGIEVDFINELTRLLNPEQGVNTSTLSGNIGKLSESDETLAQRIIELTKPESFDRAMIDYLSVFEDSKLLTLAREIGINDDKIVIDIKNRFGDDTEGLWLWNMETGEGQIRKVIREYELIKKSNTLLGKTNKSVNEVLYAWQEKLKFLKISSEIARENQEYAPFIKTFYSIAKSISSDIIRDFYDVLNNNSDSITDFLNSDRSLFEKSCASYLQGLSENEIAEIYNKNMPNDCFVMSKQDYLFKVEQIVTEYKNNLAKMQLRNLWKEKTKTDYPYQWSSHYKTPILACVPTDKWNDYKRAFGAVNNKTPDNVDVQFALEFLNANPIWDEINKQETIDNAFKNAVLGRYKAVLTNLNDVREHLAQNTRVSPYDWNIGHPEISKLIKELAGREYRKEPFAKVMKRIDSMEGEKLKGYLKRLVEVNMTVGIEILEDGEVE